MAKIINGSLLYSIHYTSFIHRTTAVEKINEQQIQLHKRTNNTNAHQRINWFIEVRTL